MQLMQLCACDACKHNLQQSEQNRMPSGQLTLERISCSAASPPGSHIILCCISYCTASHTVPHLVRCRISYCSKAYLCSFQCKSIGQDHLYDQLSVQPLKSCSFSRRLPPCANLADQVHLQAISHPASTRHWPGTAWTQAGHGMGTDRSRHGHRPGTA